MTKVQNISDAIQVLKEKIHSIEKGYESFEGNISYHRTKLKEFEDSFNKQKETVAGYKNAIDILEVTQNV